MVCSRKISMLSIYRKYVVFLGSLYLKGQKSKNSKNRQANTTMWVSHRKTRILFIEYIIEFEISDVCYVFADVDQGFYRESWVEFNFS